MVGEYWRVNSYNDIHMRESNDDWNLLCSSSWGICDLVLQKNDGSSYSTIYQDSNDSNFFPITPEANRFYLLPGHLWHYVDFNTGAEDRISISVNYFNSIYVGEGITIYSS